MLYWWTQVIDGKNFWGYYKAFQQFVNGLPLTNGNYQDAKAVSSSGKLRAWGQKDLTNNRAHVWVDNAPYTWKNVVDGNTPAAISGTVAISGFTAPSLRVERWDTTTGTSSSCSNFTYSNGVLTLTISNLASDEAYKIYP
jgi:hypothetical protein